MARRPRLYLPDCPLHIIQRGNNRDACFRDDSDYKAYLYFMREAAAQYSVSIHAFVLMTNHVHILATPSTEKSVSRTFKGAVSLILCEFGVRSKTNLLVWYRDAYS